MLLLDPNLEGTRLRIQTDHNGFKWILNLMDATGKLARWRLGLFKREFDIVHLAKIRHQATDTLSRLPTAGENCNRIDYALPFMSVSSLPNNVKKGPIKSDYIIDDCKNSGVTVTYLG